MDMRTPAWLLLTASLFSGCMMQTGKDGEPGLSTGREEQGLGFQAPSYDPEPPATEIPSCWWVDNPADCDVKPECVPKAPSDTGIARPLTLAVAQTSAVRRTTATLARMPARSGGSSSPAASGLSLKAKDACPWPNGVPACSTCSRLPNDPAVAKLVSGLSSRVLVSNGTYGNYMVKTYPMLGYSFYSTGETDSSIEIDLEEEGDTNLVSGSVDFEEDLYMFFTADYDTGPYPMGYWVFCPKNGNTCVQVTE